MELSLFGEKYTRRTGILELMDDLGASADRRVCMLGGGNPAHIPAMCRLWKRRMKQVLRRGREFEGMLANYDSSRGRRSFLEALSELLNRRFGWKTTARNIAVTNGSQSAFYLLLNMYSGRYAGGRRRRILFPLAPEYIGYADQALESGSFVSRRSDISPLGEHTFKYRVDFDGMKIGEDISAICVSRPTNPTGNVLTDGEVRRLAGMAQERSIPLLLDNAYGSPFPDIIFEDVESIWGENVVLVMSLSKLGLPGVRTGIVIAREEVIDAVSAMNAVISLSTGSIGPALLLPLVQSGEIIEVSRNIIRPYYRRRSLTAIHWITEALEGKTDFAIHKSEGAFFLWIWFRSLPIGTHELYERLKRRGVIVVPGRYFFYGLEEPWSHQDECIRLNFSQDEEEVRKGIEILADEVAGLC